MGTSRINLSVPFLKSVVAQGKLLAASPFTLVDVGASGGIGTYWKVFEPCLRAFGFDPLVKECGRLNREEKNPNVRYIDCFLGSKRFPELFPTDVASDPLRGWSNQPFERTSAGRVRRLQTTSYEQSLNGNDPEIIFSERRTSIDAFFRDYPNDPVDFIKVDTDGYDYEILTSSAEVITDRQVLGLFVECQFHGITHPHSNLFANVDRFMREHGFSLFDMEIYRYTRGVLPGHFQRHTPAHTDEGQVLWADVLYLRDAAAPGYSERWKMELSPEKLLKLACLFELFGMPDCAAEVLLTERNKLLQHLDISNALDLLAQDMDPKFRSYDELNRRFDQAPEAFFPRSVTGRLRRILPRTARGALSRLKGRLADFLIRV
jgi:hypothetical protein